MLLCVLSLNEHFNTDKQKRIAFKFHQFNDQFEWLETHHGIFEFTTTYSHVFDSCMKLWYERLKLDGSSEKWTMIF